MIKIDEKVAKAALELTKDYNDEIHFSGDAMLYLRNGYGDVLSSVKLDIPLQDVPASISRLAEKGFFQIRQAFWGGHFCFSITPYLLHRRAFFWDRFTKKFWGGFAVGVAAGVMSTVVGGLLTACIRSRLGI